MRRTAIIGVILFISFILCGLSGCLMDRPKERQFKAEWGFKATIYNGGSSGLDEEKAIAIATAYINEVIEDSGYAAGYTYHSIRFDERNSAWLVTFMPDVDHKQLPCHVVLGTDGKVMFAWGKANEE